ncbi:molybdopterin molybdotransferase MoeA [Elioraea tepida]|jgi:molybdopterin molybdotransferase|uniref:Molybdopterin molybdenumtransferase n=1 Tax=Elioraea tepida TaxID=2843330 RepID=A0A975U206_9PROT|nr:gephyrin-like molybdotransferase Glp [Elioraea tepida]QXM24854.1 molybdopterin molybdotransferase MoeA [Elioraea tepida]
MISVAEARQRILAALSPVGPEVVALSAAWGRVLAAPVAARLDKPGADVSAMDGFAVRAEDCARPPARLRVVGSAPAGHPFRGTVGPGEAVRLFTGSVIPAGADSVVVQEDTDFAERGEGAGEVEIRVVPKPGAHVRPRAGDFAHGTMLLSPPRRLTARDVGLAASAGHAWLTVRRRPRVAILATGDEVTLPGDPVPEGGVVSSNGFVLESVVRAAGGEPILLPIAPDDPEAIAAAVAAARGADLVVTSGGASVGQHDLVRPALAPLGLALDFWKIAMRPGKPFMFGRVGDAALIGLPGNPVSATVCAILFLVPAIERLLGLPGAAPATVRARAGARLAANDHRADHLRATLARDADGVLVATPAARQDSSQMAVLAAADALILRPPDAPEVAAGEWVDVIPLGGRDI